MSASVVIDSKHIECVIFDLDGTMVDNMPYQAKAWLAFADKYNHHMTEEGFHAKYSGLRSDSILEDLLGKELSIGEIESYRAERSSMYQAIFEKEIQEIAGLTELLREIQSKNIKLAVATTASKANREFALDKLDVKGFFEVIVGGEHTTKGKPDPEVYLTTLEKVGVPPSRCLAFEDSLPGIQSAMSAGLKVVAVLTSHSQEELPKALVGSISDFTQVDVI